MVVIIRIIKVTAMEHHLLEVLLDNGTTVILNMAARLGNIRFMALKDMAVFEDVDVSIDGQFIRWGNKVEISVSEIFYLAQR